MNTIDLAMTIATTLVKPGEVAIFWLGQAGFLLKDSMGTKFVIDPYLTRCGERMKGFKRLTPLMLAPHELDADLYLTTHHHFDHYDYDAIPIIAENTDTVFCGPQTCVDLMLAAGIPKERIWLLSPDVQIKHKGIHLTATWADHGEMAPDAIGAMVEMEGIRFYFSGDTSYHPEYMTELAAMSPDMAMLSINGEFGNMNAQEGALCAGALGVELAVPCHFWTFAEHRGDPIVFKELLKGTGCRPVLMRQGESIILRQQSLKRRMMHESSALHSTGDN